MLGLKPTFFFRFLKCFFSVSVYAFQVDCLLFVATSDREVCGGQVITLIRRGTSIVTTAGNVGHYDERAVHQMQYQGRIVTAAGRLSLYELKVAH